MDHTQHASVSTDELLDIVEYPVTSGRYEPDQPIQRIKKLRVVVCRMGQHFYFVDMDRATVIERIKQGRSFALVRRTDNSKWAVESTVRLVNIDGQEYLRSDGILETGDSIPGLPALSPNPHLM